MSKRQINIGKELVKRTKNLNKNIETIMGKPAKSESFSIDGNNLVMYLHDSGAKNSQYVRVDFNDYHTCDKFYMIMDKSKLKGIADFIYKYLENK